MAGEQPAYGLPGGVVRGGDPDGAAAGYLLLTVGAGVGLSFAGAAVADAAF